MACFCLRGEPCYEQSLPLFEQGLSHRLQLHFWLDGACSKDLFWLYSYHSTSTSCWSQCQLSFSSMLLARPYHHQHFKKDLRPLGPWWWPKQPPREFWLLSPSFWTSLGLSLILTYCQFLKKPESQQLWPTSHLTPSRCGPWWQQQTGSVLDYSAWYWGCWPLDRIINYQCLNLSAIEYCLIVVVITVIIITKNSKLEPMHSKAPIELRFVTYFAINLDL